MENFKKGDTQSPEAKKYYKQKRDKVKENKNFIIDNYKKNFNVLEICRNFDLHYNFVVDLLKKENIYRKHGSCYTGDSSRHENYKKTMKEKYGVVNVGQLHISKLKERNNIEYKKISFCFDLDNYGKKVKYFTEKNKKYIVDTGYCYYTGIQFIDSIVGDSSNVNPNDPRKRTIEHKMSLYDGWLNGVDPEIIGGISNLVWAIRYCNSIKGNMSNDQFSKWVSILREKLINEGFPYN